MGVMPDRGLGYVLMMNVETALGRGRLTGIADGVYGLLVDRAPPSAKITSAATLVIFGALLDRGDPDWRDAAIRPHAAPLARATGNPTARPDATASPHRHRSTPQSRMGDALG
jgi:hypothetical protein